jgi:hypothetical protein
MKLSKVDLSSLVAIAHSQGNLQLLLDRGSEIELLQLPAPIQAFEGLVMLNEAVAEPPALNTYEEIAMLPVNSSCANAIGYDSDGQILQIEFHDGSVYQYSGVDEETWEDLYYSDSIGSFYNHEIKGQYDCERLDED